MHCLNSNFRACEMSVIQSSLPDSNTLHDVLPQTKYEHSTAFERRRIASIPTLDAGLVGTQLALGSPFNFVVSKSANSLVCLQECYFSVTGTLNIAATALTNGEIVTRDMLKCSQQWLLSMFQNVVLKIGGEVCETREYPILFNDYNYCMKTHLRDVEAGCLNQNNLFSHPNTTIPVATTTMQTLQYSPNSYAYFDYNISDFAVATTGTAINIDVPFTCYLPLTAMFSVEDYKPIYNTEIVITLTRSSIPDVSIGYNTTSRVTVKSIKKFVFDCAQYNMNENFAKVVQKTYQKPQNVVVGFTTGILQTLQNQQSSTPVTLTTQASLKFELKDLHIAFPKTPSNMIPSSMKIPSAANIAGNTIARYNSKWTNTPPHCYMPVPLANITVKADAYDLIDRNFQAEDIEIPIQTTKDFNICTPIAFKDNTTTITSNYYTFLYQNMLMCRRYHDVLDDGIRPEEFLLSKFMISIPCYYFSRITSNSNIVVNFTYPNYDINPFTAPSNLSAFEKGSTYSINQIFIIQHATKAITFANGTVKVSDISQSFTNDIQLGEE